MNFWKIFSVVVESQWMTTAILLIDTSRVRLMRGTRMKKFPAATSKYPGRCPPIFIKSLHKKPLAVPQGACSLVNIFGSKRVSKITISDLTKMVRMIVSRSQLSCSVTGRIHQQQPDMLGQLMGGAAGLMGGQEAVTF